MYDQVDVPTPVTLRVPQGVTWVSWSTNVQLVRMPSRIRLPTSKGPNDTLDLVILDVRYTCQKILHVVNLASEGPYTVPESVGSTC